MNKMNKIDLSILGYIILSLSIIPVLQICADPLTVDLSAYSGDYGDTIQVYGIGATPGEVVNLYWDAIKSWDGEKGLLNTTEAKVGGIYEVSFDVPEAIAGDHYIWVKDTYTGDTAVSSAFTVVPQIKLSPYIGLPGDEITINGFGFGEQVDVVGVFWDYDFTPMMLTTTPATPETNGIGSWEASFNVPSGYDYGSYTVYAEDESGFSDTATFKVGAVISFDVDEGPVGTVVEISGRGFTPANKIWLGDVWLVDGTTAIDCFVLHEPIVVDAYGDVKFEMVIPLVSDDDEKYIITVTDGVESATEKFHVIGLAKIKVDPDFGLPGATINIEGWNFAQILGEDVMLELWDETLNIKICDLKDFETDSSGYFSGTFHTPAMSAGKYALVAFQFDYNINASTSFRIGFIEFVVIVSPTSGPSGSLIDYFLGAGFTPGGFWDATLGDKMIIKDGRFDDEGRFSEYFFVPTMDPGTYILAVNDITDPDDVITFELEFTVTATTTVTLHPMEAPNGYEIMIRGKYFSAEWGIHLDFILYNMTADGKVDKDWDITWYVKDEGGYFVETDDEGNFTGYWEVFGSEVLSLGDYWINVTDENDLFAQAMFKVCALVPSTIESSDHEGYRKDEFSWDEDVYVFGSGYTPAMTHDLYIVEDVATWTDGMPLPSAVIQTTVTADGDGDIPVTKVWIAKLEVGEYDIVVDVNDNGEYDEDVDALDDIDVNSAGFFVIPELPFGTIIGIISCIVALGLYKVMS